MSELLAKAPHELKNSLNAIVGFAELLHDGVAGPVSETQRDYLREILASSRQLVHVIDRIAHLAKLDAGRLPSRPEPTDLAAVVGRVVAVLGQASERKRLRVEVAVDPGLGLVVADPASVETIVENLVGNAVRFTPEEGRVVVRIARHEGLVRVEVEDSGPGIAERDLPRLFLPFERLEAGMSHPEPGAGLGLVLVRRLVEQAGGVVGASSVTGRGSVFHATLPWPPVTASGGLEHASPPSLARAGLAARQAPAEAPLRALLVGDADRSIATLAELLELDGWSVREARGSKEALAVAAQFGPRLVLADLGRSSIAGMVQDFRESGLARDAVLVALAGDAAAEEDARRAGCDGTIPAPIDARSFAGMVRGFVWTARRATARATVAEGESSR